MRLCENYCAWQRCALRGEMLTRPATAKTPDIGQSLQDSTNILEQEDPRCIAEQLEKP